MGCSATDDVNDETNSENRNIRDLCKGISEFKGLPALELTLCSMRWLICLQILTVF